MDNKKAHFDLENYQQHESGFKSFIRKYFPSLYRFLKDVFLNFLHLLSKLKWRALQKQGEIRLNFGSGPKKGSNGWTNIDLHGADINWNLTKPIPLNENSVDIVYTSHLFEHLQYQDLLKVLSDIQRILKPGGKLSVCVPNAGFYLRAYFNQEMFIQYDEMFLPAAVNTGSGIDQVNYIAYLNGDHTFMFDEINLINILKKKNFQNVSLRDFDPSIDHKEREFESIYALATK